MNPQVESRFQPDLGQVVLPVGLGRGGREGQPDPTGAEPYRRVGLGCPTRAPRG